MTETALALHEDTLKKIDRRIESGRLQTREEVIDVAVQLLEYLTNLRRLKQAVAEGKADFEAGRGTVLASEKELKEFFEKL